MPQWDFLNFLAERGARYRTFRLRMQAEATDLIREGERIVGVTGRSYIQTSLAKKFSTVPFPIDGLPAACLQSLSASARTGPETPG